MYVYSLDGRMLSEYEMPDASAGAAPEQRACSAAGPMRYYDTGVSDRAAHNLDRQTGASPVGGVPVLPP